MAALQPPRNIFLDAGIEPISLDDLEDVEVRPAGSMGIPEADRARMKGAGIQKKDAEAPAPAKPTWRDIKGAKPMAGGERQSFPTPGDIATKIAPGAGGKLAETAVPALLGGKGPGQKVPENYSTRAPELSPLEDPLLGDDPLGEGGGAGVKFPEVGAMAVGAGQNKWGPVIDEAVARQAEGLRSASDQMSETYAQDAQVRDQLAELQGGLVGPAFDLKERAQRRANMAAQRLDQASRLYLDQVYKGLDPDRMFGPGRLRRATVVAAAIGNGNQLYSTGVAAPDTLGLIERVVDRDLSLQQAEIDNRGQAANGLLAQLQAALGDKDVAADAFRLTWLDMIKSEMEAMVPRIADAQQRAGMVQKIGELDQFRAEARAKLEEAYLGRNLDAQKTNASNSLEAQKANAANAIAAQKAGRQLTDNDHKALGAFHKEYGKLINTIRGGHRLSRLMRGALQKYGHVPGMGNLVAAKTVAEVRKYMEELNSGAAMPGVGDQERRDALDIAQAVLEWQYKKMKSAASGQGSVSDYDQAIMSQIWNLLEQKDTGSAFHIIDNDVRETTNEYIRGAKQHLTPGQRAWAISQNMPEVLKPEERARSQKATMAPMYEGMEEYQ